MSDHVDHRHPSGPSGYPPSADRRVRRCASDDRDNRLRRRFDASTERPASPQRRSPTTARLRRRIVGSPSRPADQHSDISLVRRAKRLIASSGRTTTASPGSVRPSPRTARLAFGEATGSDEAGWTDAALVIADVTAAGEASVAKRIELEGLDERTMSDLVARRSPCRLRRRDTPSGVDQSRRRCLGARHRDRRASAMSPGSGATDLEWAPDGSRLYIAGEEGVVVYSLDDSSTHTLVDTALAASLTVSPDGRTLAVERRRVNAADAVRPLADGRRRVRRSASLVSDYTRMHGIGPVWSPDGSHVVFQRKLRDDHVLDRRGGNLQRGARCHPRAGSSDGDASGAGRNPDAHRAPGDGRRATPGNRGSPTASPGPPTARRSSTSDGLVTRSRTHMPTASSRCRSAVLRHRSSWRSPPRGYTCTGDPR